MDFADDNASAELIAAVEAHRKMNASACSGPMDTLEQLKEERRIAREENAKKTKEVKLYAKKVARLQKRASKLSDDGLLVEYARRQAAKEKKQRIAEQNGNE